MTTEILGLIEIVRKLASRKAELDKEYFENFIEPAWKAFSRIHEDYMNSLREYADLVSQADIPIEKLIKKISQDSIYTRDLRTELHALLKSMPSVFLKTQQKYLADLELSMVRYFDDRSRFDIDDSGHDIIIGSTRKGNDANNQSEIVNLAFDDSPKFIDTPYGKMQGIPVARMPLVVFLARKGDASNREQARNLFNRVALNLQDKYKDASEAYYRIRKMLLT